MVTVTVRTRDPLGTVGAPLADLDLLVARALMAVRAAELERGLARR